MTLTQHDIDLEIAERHEAYYKGLAEGAPVEHHPRALWAADHAGAAIEAELLELVQAVVEIQHPRSLGKPSRFANGTAPLGRLGHHPIDPRDLRGVIVYDCDGGEAPGVDGDLVIGVAVEGHASQTAIDERGIRHPGYFDERAQGYLTLVARLTDAVTR